jgi:hypothetical protein
MNTYELTLDLSEVVMEILVGTQDVEANAWGDRPTVCRIGRFDDGSISTVL